MLLYETMSANGSLAGKCSKDQPARYCNSQKDTLCIINPHGCSRGGRPINKDENVNSASTRARKMDRTMLMQKGARTSQVLQQTNGVWCLGASGPFPTVARLHSSAQNNTHTTLASCEVAKYMRLGETTKTQLLRG